MNPDKKYMSQSSLEDDDIKFVPPAFIYKNIYEKSYFGESDRSLDLFPSKTGFPELCHYSENQNDSLTSEFGVNIADNSIPTTFDVLRNLDLELNETEDLERSNCDNDVNKIYLQIEQKHPGIFATLYSYRIPRPIVRVIIKRLIGVTLSYCGKK